MTLDEPSPAGTADRPAPADLPRLDEDSRYLVQGTRAARRPTAPARGRPREPRGAGGRPWYLRAWVLLSLVTALAGFLRFVDLGKPATYVFDEVYYAKDGCYDAGYAWRQCGLTQPGEQTFTVHPPLGRWIIAAGERLFGNRPFGWRVASATFGTLSVLLLGLLALVLWHDAVWAAVSALLLATESLNLVQSRVAMLDIFATTFILAGFLFLALDRRWMERRTPPPTRPETIDPDAAALVLPSDPVPSPTWRPWRLATGIAFGAATASKWSGALGLLGAIVLAVAFERGRRKGYGSRQPLLEALREESLGIVVLLGIVPVLVYMASYAKWWVENGFAIHAWYEVQKGMLEYSLHLRATHPYASDAWKWIFMMRPVAYYYQCVAHTATGACTRAAEIIGIGNPVVFWGSLVAIPATAIAGWRRRDWRAGLIVFAILAQYVPWFFVARTIFFFYMVPITPFLVLAGVYALRLMTVDRAARRAAAGIGELAPVGGGALAPVAVALVVLSLAAFAFFWPVLVGDTISQSWWQAHIWFSCRPGQHLCLFNWV